MSKSVIVFSLWAMVGLVLLTLALGKRRGYAWAHQPAFGDTSLGRSSVNWMAAIALSGAVLICWLSV